MSDLVDALIQQKLTETYNNPYLRFSQTAAKTIDPAAFSGDDDWKYAALTGAITGLTNSWGKEKAQEDALALALQSSQAKAAAMTGQDYDPSKFGQLGEDMYGAMLANAQAEKQQAAIENQRKLAQLQQEKVLGNQIDKQFDTGIYYNPLAADPAQRMAVDKSFQDAVNNFKQRGSYATQAGSLGAQRDIGPSVDYARKMAGYQADVAGKPMVMKAEAQAEDEIFASSQKLKAEALQARNKDLLNLEKGLIDKIEQTDTAKMLKEALPYYQGMEKAKDRQDPAVDLLFYTSFGKLMDPGSTVREGEIANVRNVTPYVASLIQEANKQMSGTGILTPQMKEQLLMVARDKIGAFQESYNSLIDRKATWAGQKGVDRESLLGGLELPLQKNVMSGGNTKVVGGVTYVKVPGGWEAQ